MRWITRFEHKNAQGGAFPARHPLDPLQNLSDKKKTAAGNFSCNAAALLLFWVYTPDFPAAPCGAANRLSRCFGCARPTALRRGEQADALLWVRSPNNRRQLFKSFCGSLRGGFFQKPPCGGANRLSRYFGCIRPTFRRQLTKSFCGSLRGGFFSKSPLFASPKRAFLFISFFFERAGGEFDDVMEKVTLRLGGRGNPSPTNIGFC